MVQQKDYLTETIKHIDIKIADPRPIINQMKDMAFQARNLYNACDIYCTMLRDTDCAVILCLSGSLVSAGLKKVIIDMIDNNMVDVIVSTGANMVDQDFFEGLGYRHYKGSQFVDDELLRTLHIDRIYDTFINEDELRICDNTITDIANYLDKRPYSSRELMIKLGEHLESIGTKPSDSIVLSAYKKGVPIFIPAFSDCSAGFGLVVHQSKYPTNHVSVDSVKDFLELTHIKINTKNTGLLMIGGGVPKNFTQDIVVAAEVLGHDVNMHKYTIQLTVADERDGALSGSTLKEAHSWGKVDTVNEQMVFGEATITFPLVVGYAYHEQSWKERAPQKFNDRQI